MAPTTGDTERLQALLNVFDSELSDDTFAINPSELQHLLALGQSAGDTVTVVDCREPIERKVSSLPGAVALSEFDGFNANDDDAERCDHCGGFVDPAISLAGLVVVFCSTGGRSIVAVRQLKMGNGIDKVAVLAGGLAAWCHLGGHLVDENGERTQNLLVVEPKDLQFFPRSKGFEFREEFQVVDEIPEEFILDCDASSPTGCLADAILEDREAFTNTVDRNSRSQQALSYIDSITERLFQEGAAKTQRHERLRELKEEHEAKEINVFKERVRLFGPESKADAIFNHLYEDAEKVRKKLDSLREKQGQRIDQVCSVKLRGNQGDEEESDDGVPYLDKLWMDHGKKLERFEKERQAIWARQKGAQDAAMWTRAPEVKEKYPALTDPDASAKQMNEVYRKMLSKFEDQREKQRKDEELYLKQHSRHGEKMPEHDMITSVERLYNEAGVRRRKVQNIVQERDKQEEHARLSCGVVRKKRTEPSTEPAYLRLYAHAEERNNKLQSAQKAKVQSLKKKLESQSIHNKEQEKIKLGESEADRVFDRLYQAPEPRYAHRTLQHSPHRPFTPKMARQKRMSRPGLSSSEFSSPRREILAPFLTGPAVVLKDARIDHYQREQEQVPALAQHNVQGQNQALAELESLYAERNVHPQYNFAPQNRQSMRIQHEQMQGNAYGSSQSSPRRSLAQSAPHLEAHAHSTHGALTERQRQSVVCRDLPPNGVKASPRASVLGGTPPSVERRSLSAQQSSPSASHQAPITPRRSAAEPLATTPRKSVQGRGSIMVDNTRLNEARKSLARASIARSHDRGGAQDLGGQLESLEVVLAAEEAIPEEEDDEDEGEYEDEEEESEPESSTVAPTKRVAQKGLQLEPAHRAAQKGV